MPRLWWRFPNFWLLVLCVTWSAVLASTGVAGDLRDEWGLPAVTVAPASFPSCPAHVCPFRSSYLSTQCNRTRGAVPLLLHSPLCWSPSLVFSDVSVKNRPLELNLSRTDWLASLSFLPPTTSHFLTSMASRAKAATKYEKIFWILFIMKITEIVIHHPGLKGKHFLKKFVKTSEVNYWTGQRDMLMWLKSFLISRVDT